jgi:hypothetical protein
MNITTSVIIDVLMITGLAFLTVLSLGKKQDVGFFLTILLIWVFMFLLDIKELYEH